jgi:serine/threonine protein kinase/tetratricopeptide (TPR) repeat protein
VTDLLARLQDALADRYRFERELGQGGMATVCLAQDLKHQRPVAIKVLKSELAAVLGAERFLREITTTANLRHPHILPLYDSGAAAGALFYVMPYVEGESLRDRLRREGQLPVDEALRLTREVAEALEYAHGQGIIHRDIKPENILLERGHAVVADFGIARAASTAGGDKLTETGLAIGTPAYMSPEQATGERDLDARSDLYALGSVLYEMLAGEPPYTGPSAQAIIAKRFREPVPRVSTLRETVPPAVETALTRVLAKSPADRFATAGEFARALTADAAGRPAPVPVTSRTLRRGIAVGLTVVGAAGLYLAVRALAAGSTGSAPTIRSIAVLPLDNYSADSTQDYFAEGMTDELTTDLATISQLRVTSRGSAMQFKGKNRPATPEIARALNVDAIVEGSVSRSGDRVRITAQLIDARADKHLWAQTFERKSSDVLALQAELASAIASAINVQLTPGEQSRLSAAPTVDPEAHDAYLKGRYFFNRPSDENLRKAIVQFEEVVRLSPTFAPAWSGLSDAYTWAAYNEGFIRAADAKPLAKAAAERAVALDSLSAEAHTSLAVFKAWFEYDWKGSEREFRQAIKLNPNYAFAHDQFGLVLGIIGRFDEAIAEGEKAIALDPLSPTNLIDATASYVYAGRTAEGMALARKAEELDPTFFFPVAQEAKVAALAGNYPEAIAKYNQARAMGAPPFTTADLAYIQGISGDRAGAMASLAELRKISPGGEAAPFNLALVYLGLGDYTRTIDYLEQAYAASSQGLVWLKRDPIYDPLRSNPRFIALMKRLNFLK